MIHFPSARRQAAGHDRLLQGCPGAGAVPAARPGSDPETWPWLPGIIAAVCGENEWQVVALDERLEQNGTYPLCYRDASELRHRSAVSLGRHI